MRGLPISDRSGILFRFRIGVKVAKKKPGGYKKSELKLTPLQRRFVLEYPKHDSVADAVRAAGYQCKNPGKQGWLLMNDARVLQRIDMNAAARRRYRKVSEENIQEELSRMGFANIKDHFDSEGNHIPIKDLPRDVMAGVKKMEVTRATNKEGDMIEQARLELTGDKKSSLELLGRRLGMWDKDGGAGLGLTFIESLGRTVGPMGQEESES